jgi:restriction system protein
MAVWLVRAGRGGERQEFCLDHQVAVIGWTQISDLSQFKEREQLEDFYRKLEPDKTPNQIGSWVGQLWAFAKKIQIGDLITLPLKGQDAVAIGKVMGDYKYEPQNPEDARHTRPVKWLVPDAPRSKFDPDLLHSLGALGTVCRIQRNNAEERIKAIAKGQPIPATVIKANVDDDSERLINAPERLNLGDSAATQIREHIGQKFAGHHLADLVDAILKVQGYQTQVSEPGPDGGVDIIAGRGPMGFDPPKLCVQVKSGDGQQDVKVLRELKGVMQDFGAEQGLFVSWGGFRRTVISDAKRAFFEIRLWDASALVEAVFRHYDQFPEDIKADLPLKRIWTLVNEE